MADVLPQVPVAAEPVPADVAPVEPVQPEVVAAEPMQLVAEPATGSGVAPSDSGDDLTGAYQAHRQDFSQDDALTRALALADAQSGAQDKGVEGKKLAGGKTITPPTAADEQHFSGLAGPFTQADLKTGAAVAGDVATGVRESTPVILQGIHDAGQNLTNSVFEFSNWLGTHAHGRHGEPAGGRTNAGEPAKLDLPELPLSHEATSKTGALIQGTAQFLTGFKGADKMVKGIAMLKTGTIASQVKSALSMATAFDPHADRLSNLIQKFPALKNPMTEFLASDPTDNAAEGRFKSALEGLGIGVVAEGLFKAVSVIRDAAHARSATQGPTVEAILAQRDELPTDAFTGLGDESAPLVPSKTTATSESVAGAAGTAGPPKGETFINFARIDTDEDVQKVMQHLADAGPPAADEARAGVQTHAQVQMDAAHTNAWEALKNRREGDPLPPAQALAARELWNATTIKTAELAKVAFQNPNESNLFAFRKMLAIQDTVQRAVLGARAATARALASWRIPAGEGAQRLQEVMAVLNATGGNEVARELARRYSKLASKGMMEELVKFTEKGAYARNRDAVLEAWINGLLSNPATHLVNTLSNSIVIAMRMAERAAGSQISAFLGTQDGVALGEASSQWFGLMQGSKEMFSYYSKMARLGLAEDREGIAAMKGQSPAQELGLSEQNKMEHLPSISSNAFKISSDTQLGRAVDLGGQLVRGPGTALRLEDEFFKTVGYRMELNAQALRQAMREMQAGQITEDGLKARTADLVANPGETLRLEAIDAATYQTFTNTAGEISRLLARVTAKFPLAKVLLPFTRTPSNILRFTFERTPLAPAVGQFRANIAAGGARRDLALAQMSLGTMAMTAFADATLSGQMTGRIPPTGGLERGNIEAWMRQGWKPYSKLVNGRWVQYSRLDPIGSQMGMAADFTQMMALGGDMVEDPDDPQSVEKVVAAMGLAFAGNITNKTYLSGLSNAVEALSDPTRYGESQIQRLAGSLVPAGVAATERAFDPTVRQVYTMMDSMQARIPGLSEKLPFVPDLWGEPRKFESGLGKAYDFLTPAYSQKVSDEPIDKEMIRLQMNQTMPVRKTSFNGVQIDLGRYPQAYQRYVELAGNKWKDPAWHLGAKDLLNKIVTGKHTLSAIYKTKQDGAEGGKAVFIQHMITQYREHARHQLLKEYPEIRKEVERKRDAQMKLKLPVTQ